METGFRQVWLLQQNGPGGDTHATDKAGPECFDDSCTGYLSEMIVRRWQCG